MSLPAQFKQLAWLARLRTLRGWALGLGLVSMVSAMTASGLVSTVNPKTWSSAYSAMAAAGMLRWAALPLVMLGAALLALAVVLHIAVRSHSRRLQDLRIDEQKK
jgi:hypothetical protein